MITAELLDKASKRAKETKWSKNAFNCSKCPKGGCPAWWDIDQDLQNTETKQIVTKTIEGCGFALLPVFILDSVSASYMTKDALEQKHNELIEGLRNTFKLMTSLQNKRLTQGEQYGKLFTNEK